MQVAARVSLRYVRSPWRSSDVPEAEPGVQIDSARPSTRMTVGIGTALADDPQPTARDTTGAVGVDNPCGGVDSRASTPATAQVWDASAETLICHRAPLRRRSPGPPRPAAADAVRARPVACPVESGPRLTAAFIDADLVATL